MTLPGQFSYDAMSRDGSIVYFVEHLPPAGSGNYRVRAYDVADGPLPARGGQAQPAYRDAGSAVARTSTRDGRWVFTLYRSSEHIFVHSLDVDHAAAICLDVAHVDGIEPAREGSAGRLALSTDARTLQVIHAGAVSDIDLSHVTG